MRSTMFVVRVARLELAVSAWKADRLPLTDTRRKYSTDCNLNAQLQQKRYVESR